MNNISHNNEIEILNKSSNLTGYLSKMSNQSIAFATIFSMIFVFGLIANLLVILVYLFNKTMKNHSNYFFANLSLSDILVIAVCIPIAISDLVYDGEWIFGYFYCKYFFLFEN